MKEIAKILLELKAVSLNVSRPFRWASGMLSPIYCDSRIIISHPGQRARVVEALAGLASGITFDVIAGTATAGIPWAAFLAHKLNKPMVYVRARAKDHGKQNLIEGRLSKGQKALVVEDLVSTGSSSIRTIEALRSNGCIVEDCIAIFTYLLEDSATNYSGADVNLMTLTNIDELADVAEEEGFISADEKQKINEWRANPRGWSL